MNEKKRYLLTGTSGFIGSNLLSHLKKDSNAEVYIITTSIEQHNKYKENSFYYSKANDSLSDDLNDNLAKIRNLEAFLQKTKPQILIHVATNYNPNHKTEEIQELINANITFGLTIIELACKNGVKHIVNTASEMEFQSAEQSNLYGLSKKMLRLTLAYYAKKFNVNIVSLVLYGSYGISDKRGKLLDTLITNTINNEESIVTNINQELALTNIKDIIKGYELAISILESYNIKVSTAKEFSVKSENVAIGQIINYIERYTKIKPKILDKKQKVKKIKEISKQLPDWQETISIEQGIKELCKHHLQNR